MKIMKAIDKKVGDTTYVKYKINIPKKVAEESGLLDKDVEVKLVDGRIIVERN